MARRLPVPLLVALVLCGAGMSRATETFDYVVDRFEADGNLNGPFDGIVDVITQEINDVVDQIDAPSSAAGWKQAVRQRILSARDVFLRHPWAPRVFETRTNTGVAVLRYFDGLLGLMRAGGFSYDLAHHAMHALGSRALGFTQELFDPSKGAGPAEATPSMEELADQLPHLVGMMAEIAHDDPDSTLGWCDDQTEFEFGLDLILDGLDKMRKAV